MSSEKLRPTIKTILILEIWSILIIAGNASSDILVANVTKIAPQKKANISIDEPVPSKSTKRSDSVFLQKDFPVPKAISANAGEPTEDGGYAVFPLPPPTFYFPQSKDGGVEETFTYQVKKQRQSPNVPPYVQDEYSLLQQRAKRESFETMQHIVNELNNEVSEKVHNLTISVRNLGDAMMGNVSAVTSAWDQLNQDVLNLTKLSKDTSRVVKLVQHTQDEERKVIQEQVSNLTAEMDNMAFRRSEDMIKILSTLAGMQEQLDNTTHELRIHEGHLRYGQQVMSSMKDDMERNVERITGLETDGEPQWTEQTIGCGGVVIANSGIVSYKFRQPYLNNERCVWIIRANRKTKINLQLLEDGFQNQTNSDFLTVTEFAEEQHPVTLITSSRLEHGNNALHTFQGPVIFLTFYSDATQPGTGFTLKFDGVGNRTDAAGVNAVRYRNMHYTAPIGVFTYPSENVNGNDITYQPHELVTLAINPQNADMVKISLTKSDLEKDEHCEFDSLSFYGSVTGSYALTKRYCQQVDNFPAEIIQSDGIFLVIFRSDGSTQFSGFQFTWEIE